MKMKKEHFNYLRDSISEFLKEHPEIIENYRNLNFPHSDRVKNLQQRFSWDLIYMTIGIAWICHDLYPYLNDSHIETALNHIVPKI